MRLRARGAPLVAIAVLASLAVGVQPAAAAEQVVLSKGHTDAVDVHYEGGALSLQVHDDTVSPAVYRDPADVTFHALPASAVEVPDHPDYAFLGPAGTTVWMLPQVQDPDLLWPGWNTTTLQSGVFAGDAVTMSLVDVEGPGDVWVFMSDALGLPLHKFRTDDGLPDALQVPVHTHAHANWAFSATGTYTLTFQADATLAGGTPVSTGPVDYTFVIGDLAGPDPDPDPELNLDVYGLEDSYTPGQQVNLVALTDVETTLDHFHWFSKCPGAADFAVVQGELTFSYQFTATAALNGCQYKAVLYDDDHNAVAEADPVTLVVTSAGDPGGASQSITATVRETDGALVISVNPDDRTVALPATTVSASGDRLEASGALRPVTVTDTRAGQPGWNASGQVSDFVAAAGGSFAGRYLGWTPQVIGQAEGQGVVAGPAAPPGFTTGNGLAGGAVLGSAPAGSGRGTAQLGAVVQLELPTETPPGQFTATLTLTAI